VSDRDVYAFGVVAPSTLYAIADAFPAPEGYEETLQFMRSRRD